MFTNRGFTVLENEQFWGKTGTKKLFTIECLGSKDVLVNIHTIDQKDNFFLLLDNFTLCSVLNQHLVFI